MEGQRPGGLLTIAILALLLGILGGCGGLWGIAGTMFQERVADMQQDMLDDAGGEQARAQRQMQERMLEVTRSWRPALVTQESFNVLFSVLLLVAGVMLLRWARPAPMVFFVAVAGNLLVDIGGTIVDVLVQQETQQAMRESMQEMFQDPGAPPGMDRTMEGMMQAGTGVNVCFAVGWTLLKIAFYVTGVIYLRRPRVRRMFDGGDDRAEPPPGPAAGG